jgi:hypothetical protein
MTMFAGLLPELPKTVILIGLSRGFPYLTKNALFALSGTLRGRFCFERQDSFHHRSYGI